jgi:glycosyltransferase involved in cell wall biosynthesis
MTSTSKQVRESPSKRTIGIDLTGLWRPATGIYVYALELAQQLLAFHRDHNFTLFFTQHVPPEFREFEGRFKAVMIPVRNEVLSKQFVMGAWSNRLGLDLIHFPTFPPALACFRPTIWTIHDATAWLYPETMSWKGRSYFGRLGALAARSSKAIITVSNESKRNIVEALRVPEDKVKVIYEGINPVFKRVEDAAELQALRRRYQLPERFLLSVGTLEPRKNLPFLIKVFKVLRDSYAAQPGRPESQLGLVVVGRRGWKSQEIDEALGNAGSGVILTGFVPREDLVGLYSSASALVLTSLYEGFGFPPLEATACGCPVVVSNRGSLSEVVGTTGRLLELGDIRAWVETLRMILDNPAASQPLIEKGRERMRRFSWKTAAAETLELYSQVASGVAMPADSGKRTAAGRAQSAASVKAPHIPAASSFVEPSFPRPEIFKGFWNRYSRRSRSTRDSAS